jgi:hypothetical protein
LKPVKHLLGFKLKKLNQDIILIFKIKIDSAVGNPGLICDLSDSGFIKTLLGKNLDSSLENTVVFIL